MGAIGSIYKQLERQGEVYEPKQLQSAKIFLLSNLNMAKFCRLLSLDLFIISDSPEALTEIEQARQDLERCVQEESCKQLVKFKFKVPKTFGDIWEALAGALLLDGGWELVNSVFGKAMAPFVSYFCKNLKEMEMNFKSEALEICKDPKNGYRLESGKMGDLYYCKILG